jgi:hypothetical protein
VEGIEWRTTDTGAGWIEHCNALLAEATTEFFMWLPHDDEIDTTWIRNSERMLGADRSAILAVGSVEPVGEGVELPFNETFESADPDLRVEAALTDLVSGRAVSLGLLFRSVFRRDRATPLPDTEWSDVPWAIAMLASGRAARTDAVYRKRWHPASVSAGWSPMADSPDFRSTHIVRAIAQLGDSAPTVVARAWEAEVAQMATRARVLESELATVVRTLNERSMTPLRRLWARLSPEPPSDSDEHEG